jgi:hypothetical protein
MFSGVVRYRKRLDSIIVRSSANEKRGSDEPLFFCDLEGVVFFIIHYFSKIVLLIFEQKILLL